jgi:hypothetical protein
MTFPLRAPGPRRVRARRRKGVRIGLLGLVLVATACFTGAEREKRAPPGHPGGLCLAPDGQCTVGSCNRDANYCYDPADPCFGFFCGGSDRGTCLVDSEGLPSCQCNVGFENETFELYCCPIGTMVDVDCENAPEDSDASSGS